MTEAVISGSTVQNVANVFTLINSLSFSVGELPVRSAPPSCDHSPIWLTIVQDVRSVISAGRTIHLHITAIHSTSASCPLYPQKRTLPADSHFVPSGTTLCWPPEIGQRRVSADPLHSLPRHMF